MRAVWQRTVRWNRPVTCLAVWVLLGCIALQAEEKKWPPAEGVPMTRWGKQVSADKPVLPEYPRPQLVRERWENLNGLWDYAVLPIAEASQAKDAQPAPESFALRDLQAAMPSRWDGKILVPYPIESVLSQVNKRIGDRSRLWYRRTVTIPASWAGQRVLLHFGAVDWETTVAVNGKTVGVHRGGYDGFSFDITSALTAVGPQELVVAVWDPTEGGQPEGKQSREPGGIFYTPTSGIWQTVWLEPVPQSSIDRLKIVPDVDGGKVRVSASTTGDIDSLEVVVLADGKEVARAAGSSKDAVVVAVPNARLWWPDAPFLYDLKITAKKGAETADAVTSYFGMRKVSLGPDAQGRTRMLLNNKYVFHNGVLDQGFWPDGLYTAPTDEALRYDVEMTKKIGFNMSRKHIKVEPDRWYYWCDKLGLLVWQDMPAVILRRKSMIGDIDAQFELEMRRMIEGMYNHPSIVMWVLFNEGWGLEMSRTAHETPSDATQAMVRRMVDAARQEDTTRLMNHESGAGGGGWQGKNPWDIGLGDIVDFHCYGGIGPMWEKNRASVIGETGWGLAAKHSVEVRLPEIEARAISGLVITQLTDVENECNGAMSYDRVLKGKESAEEIGEAMRAMLEKSPGTNPAAK